MDRSRYCDDLKEWLKRSTFTTFFNSLWYVLGGIGEIMTFPQLKKKTRFRCYRLANMECGSQYDDKWCLTDTIVIYPIIRIIAATRFSHSKSNSTDLLPSILSLVLLPKELVTPRTDRPLVRLLQVWRIGIISFLVFIKFPFLFLKFTHNSQWHNFTHNFQLLTTLNNL